MAHYISERELRKLERERRKEQMEQELRMIEKQEEEERSEQLRKFEEMREGLVKERRREKEKKREQSPGVKGHVSYSHRPEEMRRGRHDPEVFSTSLQELVGDTRHSGRAGSREQDREDVRHTEVAKRKQNEIGYESNRDRRTLESESRTPKDVERRVHKELEKEKDEAEMRRRRDLDKLYELQRQREEETDRELDKRGHGRDNYGNETEKKLQQYPEDRDHGTLVKTYVEPQEDRDIKDSQRKVTVNNAWHYGKYHTKEDENRHLAHESTRIQESSPENKGSPEYLTIEERRYHDSEKGETPHQLEYSIRNQEKKGIAGKAIPDGTRYHDSSLEKTMNWLDDRFQRLQAENRNVKKERTDDRIERKKEEQGILRREKYAVGYETDETDDEIEKAARTLEKLKLKEMELLEEIKAKHRLKLEREERRRQEAHEKRREEKKQKLLLLREEQLRILDEVRKHEETLNALSSSESEHDEHTLKYAHPKEETDRRNQRKDDSKRKSETITQTIGGQRLIMPKLPILREETFEEWKLEVEVMMESNLYQKDALLHVVRNSLINAKSGIRRVLPTIDPKATTREILDKLENIYGDRRSGESHLSEFYKAKQRPNENVAEWGIRLENIMQKAVKKGQVSKEQTDQMLRTRFWKQLHDEKLKLSTRLFYETCKNYEELMKKVRVEENEMNSDSDNSKVSEEKRPIALNKDTETQDDMLSEVLQRLKNVERELERPTERHGQSERHDYGSNDRSSSYRREFNSCNNRGRQFYRNRDRYRRDHSNWRRGQRDFSRNTYENRDDDRKGWRNRDRNERYDHQHNRFSENRFGRNDRPTETEYRKRDEREREHANTEDERKSYDNYNRSSFKSNKYARDDKRGPVRTSENRERSKERTNRYENRDKQQSKQSYRRNQDNEEPLNR